jgi:hypothetical protein
MRELCKALRKESEKDVKSPVANLPPYSVEGRSNPLLGHTQRAVPRPAPTAMDPPRPDPPLPPSRGVEGVPSGFLGGVWPADRPSPPGEVPQGLGNGS